MSAARRPKRDRVRRAIWPREVTRCVYNDHGAHAGIQITRIHVHMSIGFWILPRLSTYTCKNCQRTTCVRKNVGDYAGPISRSVGRSVRFCEFALQNYDGRTSRVLVLAAKTLVLPSRNYERSLRRCWWYSIIGIAAMLTRRNEGIDREGNRN